MKPSDYPAGAAAPPPRIRDLPERQKPREMFDRLGAANVPDEVLLALILRTGRRGANAMDLARELLRRHGSLEPLTRATQDELARVSGIGPVKAQMLKAALELARRVAEERNAEQPLVRAPADVVRVLREEARVAVRECFWALLLDTRNRLVRPPVEITAGVLDASLVHPREVFREAVRGACAKIIVAHNHPSGDPTPSAEDVRITRQLVEAGRVVGIPVLDHVVLGRRRADPAAPEFVSLRDSGLASFGE